MQQSEWVYRCEECDFDIHALCTKYPKEIDTGCVHQHPLTMIQCRPQKIVLSIQCCNSAIRGQGWYYKCVQKFCGFCAHPLCSSILGIPVCIFDHSHRLDPVTHNEIFHCGRCGSLGYSWFYQCEHCDVQLHLDCIEDINEGKDDQNGAYAKFMIDYGMTSDDHTKKEMISKLMNDTLFHTPSKASPTSTSLSHSPSSSSTIPAMMLVQPIILRPTETEKTILDGIVNENLCKEIAVDNEKRKVEKMALVKEARQQWKVNLFEVNRSLKKNVEDLLSSKTLSQADKDILSIRLKTLRERCCTLGYEVNALRGQGQGQMSNRGPRIVLFFDYGLFCRDNVRALLTSLRRFVGCICLCEEFGHEHIVDVASNRVLLRGGDEIHHKLQPLLRAGLQVVARVIQAFPVKPSTLDSLTVPISGKWKLNLLPSDLETYNLQNMKAFESKEDVEALKMAEDFAAELFLSYLDDAGVDIFKSFGLRRVRYVESDESKVPCYTQGMVAWLSNDHLNSGLEAGILEPYPSKFYNPGYDIVRDN